MNLETVTWLQLLTKDNRSEMCYPGASWLVVPLVGSRRLRVPECFLEITASRRWRVISLDNIIRYYEQYNEDIRLKKDRAHYLEYLTTIRYLDKICRGRMTILDACAGTGVYCFYLAEKGHTVTAGDITPSNVDIIKQKQRENPILNYVYTGDILDLSRFADESFDIVLCLGALYHLHGEGQRKRAVLECKRVLRKGGLILAAYINRFAIFAIQFSRNPSSIHDFARYIYQDAEVFHFSTPAEIERLMMECGIVKKYGIATDGIAYMYPNQLQCISEEDFSEYLDYHYAICEDKSMLGCSQHGLFVGEK